VEKEEVNISVCKHLDTYFYAGYFKRHVLWAIKGCHLEKKPFYAVFYLYAFLMTC